MGCWKGLGSERHSPKFPWSGENRLGPSKSHSVPGRWSCAWLLTLKATKGMKTLSWTRALHTLTLPSLFPDAQGGSSLCPLPTHWGSRGSNPLSSWLRARARARAGPSQAEASPDVFSGSVQRFQIWFGSRCCQLLQVVASWGKLLTFLYFSFLVCGVKAGHLTRKL